MKENGFSVVEVMLATALFVIFSSGAVTLVLGGMENNRQSDEQAVANQFATEGLEAVRSIRNQSYDILNNNSGIGVTNVNGVWSFEGSSNVFDKFTRVITVAEVQRDGNGEIVVTGGSVDPDTKKITSTVSWMVNTARTVSVVLETYLTNWQDVITISPTTCAEYAVANGYEGGTCRQNTNKCSQHDEDHLVEGDIFCVGGSSADTCCGLPLMGTPTPTKIPTPIPTNTLTPTPLPVTTCGEYCIELGYSSGICRNNSNQCRRRGEVYQSGGNIYCIGGPSADTCCCK